VLVLSGMPDIEQEYEGLDARFQMKPVPPGELIRVLQDLMGSQT
jgi:hypothetical protein